jgi:uncharacterized protein
MNTLNSIAFLTGLVGSFHCVGMCGPIALALPVGGQSVWQATINRLLYNLGRILTYSTLGAIFGYFGRSIFIAGYQQQLAILVGILLLFSMFPVRLFVGLPIYKITNKIIHFIKKLFAVKSAIGFLMLGIANGLLPCGMVYMALAGATISNSPIDGAIFMVFFGVGTAPMMFSVSFLPKFLTLNMRQKINKYIPVYTFLFAILFVARGLGLGIPYFSPKMFNETKSKSISICNSPKI